MMTTLSSKGQIVVPASYRKRLGLRAGARFRFQVKGDSLVFTPERVENRKPKLVYDKSIGIWITKAPPGAPKVTSEQVKALLADFP